MSSEFFLERRERAVEVVGGVGDIELGILEVRKEVGQVCFQ